jgi:predicted membrane protein
MISLFFIFQTVIFFKRLLFKQSYLLNNHIIIILLAVYILAAWGCCVKGKGLQKNDFVNNNNK